MSTNRPERDQQRLPNSTAALAALAGAATVAMIGTAVWDITNRDRLPDTVVAALGFIAMLCAGPASNLAAAHSVKRRISDLKTDTGSIPRITDTLADMPTLGDAFHAVAVLSGEVQQMTVNVSRLMSNYEWLVADRKRLQKALAETGPNRSEYWKVYEDVMTDLGTIPPDAGGMD